MSYAKDIIQKYVDMGIIKDNTSETDWKEIIGSAVCAAGLIVLIYLFFTIL